MSKGRSSKRFSRCLHLLRDSQKPPQECEKTWGPGMSKTLCHRMNRFTVLFGSAGTRPSTFSTAGKKIGFPRHIGTRVFNFLIDDADLIFQGDASRNWRNYNNLQADIRLLMVFRQLFERQGRFLGTSKSENRMPSISKIDIRTKSW